MSTSFKLAEGEKIVKQYPCTRVDYRLLFLKGTMPKKRKSKYNTEGVMTVTNKRLIYAIDNHSFPVVGLKCRDLDVQEVSIDSVVGTSFQTSHMKASYLGPIIVIILGVLLMLLSLILGAVVAIIGLFWLMLRILNKESMVVFTVTSSAASPAINVASMSRGYAATVSYWMEPTANFEVMANEIGALILDLQKYGDDCISKWQPPMNVSARPNWPNQNGFNPNMGYPDGWANPQTAGNPGMGYPDGWSSPKTAGNPNMGYPEGWAAPPVPPVNPEPAGNPNMGFMKVCRNCGNQLSDGTPFCPNCGARV